MSSGSLAGMSPVTKWGRRHTVFLIVSVVNLVVWLDSGIFGALTPYWSKAMHLTPTQIGTASSAYLLGYFPLLLVAGVLADRFSAKSMLLLCLGGVTIMSASMLAVDTYTLLFLRNLLFGVFFGFLWAPCNRMMAMWLTGPERARYTAIWMSFTLGSFIIAAPLGLLIAAHFAWRDAFGVVTLLGIPMFFILLTKTTDQPEQDRRALPEEVAYINQGRASREQMKSEGFRWSDLRKALNQRSVLWMIIATGLTTTPTWLIGTWGTYGLINDFHLSAGQTSLWIDLMLVVPVAFGFANGWVVNRLFGGRTRPALAIGPVVGGVGFILAALLHSNYIAWVGFLYAVGYMADPLFWGTVNAYWSGLTKPEFTGTLNGISAALQVAIGYLLVSNSGNWVNTHVTGVASLNTIWIIGGVVFFAGAVPVLLSREVRLRLTQVAQTDA